MYNNWRLLNHLKQFIYYLESGGALFIFSNVVQTYWSQIYLLLYIHMITKKDHTIRVFLILNVLLLTNYKLFIWTIYAKYSIFVFHCLFSFWSAKSFFFNLCTCIQLVNWKQLNVIWVTKRQISNSNSTLPCLDELKLFYCFCIKGTKLIDLLQDVMLKRVH